MKPKARAPRLPTLTLVIDEKLRGRLDRHKDANWSEFIRRCLGAELDRLERRK